METISFVFTNRLNLLHHKSSSDRLVINCCKRFLETAKPIHANKTKASIISQELGWCDFWWIANSVLNKSKSAIPPLFNGPDVLSSASDKTKLFAENFSWNSNFDDSGICLYAFSFRTYSKMHDIPVAPKRTKKVIINLDSSR